MILGNEENLSWKNQDCIAYIEYAIQEFDKVLLVTGKMMDVLNQESFDETNLSPQKILILSVAPFIFCGEGLFYRRISKKMEKQLIQLYHSYEFTDNFILLEQTSGFATLFNFVRTGILTLNEAWQVLLR